MTVYMKVTTDKFALPVAFAESKSELAKICGVDVSIISHAVKNMRTGKARRSKYVAVFLPDDEEDENGD